MSVRIGINGFGRIGRLAFRAAQEDDAVDVVAVNDLTEASTMAHLLRYDSVHGPLDGEIGATDEGLQVNGRTIAYTAIKDPARLPWQEV